MKKVDIFGKPVGFTVDGDEKVRSRLGGVTSLCILVVLLVCASLTLTTELQRPLLWNIQTTTSLMSSHDRSSFKVYHETNFAESI